MPDAAYLRIDVKAGSDFSIDLDLRHGGNLIDTTGWVGFANLQTLDGFKPYDSTNAPISFSVAFPYPGVIRLAMPATKNNQLQTKRYLYDVKILDSLMAAAYYLDGDVIVGRSVS